MNSFMRRLVTQYVGIRHLFEASAVEPAKLGVRAQFESLIAVTYLMFGGRRKVDFHSAIDARRRESRARYFYVAAERREIYMRQVLSITAIDLSDGQRSDASSNARSRLPSPVSIRPSRHSRRHSARYAV